MSDELIQWFRNGGECAERGEECRVRDAKSGCTCTNAADTITALRAEVKRLTEEAVDQYSDGLHDGCDAASDRWEKEVAALRADNERLRAALRPFACDCGPGGEEPCPKPENCRNYIARAALEEMTCQKT